MGLNFGGTSLFPTRVEELWKGVFNDRKEEPSGGASSRGSYLNLGTGWTDVGVSVDILVKPDQRVVVLATAVADEDTDNDIIDFGLLRNNTFLETTGFAHSETISIQCGLSIMTIDDPGEGVHTYKLQGRSAEADGDLLDINLVAFTIGVS